MDFINDFLTLVKAIGVLKKLGGIVIMLLVGIYQSVKTGIFWLIVLNISCYPLLVF